MNAIHHLFAIVIHPRRTARTLAQAPSIHFALAVVLVFGVVVGLMFLASYLAHDYPPPPAELRVWIGTWGEFAMLPFLAIPAEHYRLFLAILMVPLARSFAAYFMPIVWPAVLLLGGIYNGIATHELERFPLWKVALIALATCAWPIVLLSVLLR